MSITLPFAGQEVRLRLADLDVLCEVLTRDEERLMLAVALDRAADADAEVVFSHPCGVVSLVGTVAPGAECAAFRIASQRTLVQRRDAFRVPLVTPARLRLPGGGGDDDEVQATTVDLSVRSARVLTSAQVEVDDCVTLELELDTAVLSLPGTVVRRDDGGFGMRFDPLSRAVDDQLSHFLTAEQRNRMKRG